MKESVRRSLRKRLLSLMREVSESHFFAGWSSGLEYGLWQAVLQHPQPYEAVLGPIDEESVAELKDLAGDLQEWAVWDDEAGEKLIPLTEWRRIFAAHETASCISVAGGK